MASGGPIAGSEISYRSLGNRTVEVTYSIYTDQSGGCPGTLSPIEARSVNCNVYFNDLLSLQNPQGEIVGPGCNNQFVFTRWIYTGVLQLPTDCDDWRLSVNECCRGASISSIQTPEQSAVYSEVWINSTAYGTSSIEFNATPSFVVWEGQNNKKRVSTGMFGLDSVVIESARPRISISSDVNYLAGYSENRPVHSAQPITIDRNTGGYEIMPLTAETGLIAFRATGYLGGRPVSSIFREQRLLSIAPSNRLPELSGVDGTSGYTINQCSGTSFSHFFLLNDPDAAAVPVATEIIGLPGAQFTISNRVLQVNWPGSASLFHDTTILFSIRINDQQCPVASEQIFFFQLNIRTNSPNNSVSAVVSDATCANSADGVIALTCQGISNPIVVWSDGSTDLQRQQLTPGMYHLSVTDPSSGCSIAKNYALGFNHLPPSVSLGTDQTVCNGTDVVLGPGSGYSNYTWNDGSDIDEITVSQSGYYHVTVTDQYGCTASAGTSIQFQTCTGIDENSSSNKFRIYPNPASDLIRFSPGGEREYEWSIIDACGRKISANNGSVIGETVIQLENLASGIYHLEWRDMEGAHSTRFMKR
ncbi:MAG: T9SS type A sorting domain-containing protein [Bacteroidota bacterium]